MKSQTYEWILFDADETLFHFDAFCGLQLVFKAFDIIFTEEHYLEYQTKNKSLWQDFQKGLITSHDLQHQRFSVWGEKLQVTPQSLNSLFLNAMAEICKPLDGAVDLLNALKGKNKLGLITNGFTELQQKRLERTGLKNHFEFVVISEQIGIAKPNRGIFEHAFSIMGHPALDSVLMVGDTLESDILGGINAGIHTCWYNPKNQPLINEITPHYQVASLKELEEMLILPLI